MSGQTKKQRCFFSLYFYYVTKRINDRVIKDFYFFFFYLESGLRCIQGIGSYDE